MEMALKDLITIEKRIDSVQKEDEIWYEKRQKEMNLPKEGKNIESQKKGKY